MDSDLHRIFTEFEGVELLAQLVAVVRPHDGAPDAADNLRALTVAIRQDDVLVRGFCSTIRGVFSELRLVHTLVESGILSDRGVVAGVKRLVGHALLPPVNPDHDLRAVLPRVFREPDDWEWVTAVPNEMWADLFDIAIKRRDALGLPHEDIAAAIRALAQRLGAEGIDEDINAKLTHVEDYNSPFMDLSVYAHRFLEDHRECVGSAATYEAVIDKAEACRELVVFLRENKHIYGTSVRLTGVTRRLLQQLDRLDLLVGVVRPATPRALSESIVLVFKSLVESEQTAGSVRRLVGQYTDLWAHQITEHTAKKGEKYISRSGREYWGFLLAAMGGGALVAVFAVVKLFLSKLSLPLAVQALVYGLNYSICFILIYLTGAILATKQPAVTASAIARCLDDRAHRGAALDRVADTIVLVWRSQFISFVGNLVCAFPVAILIAYGLEQALAIKAADLDKAEALLDGNHPWMSGALFYAAIAGVFLFTSGVIQGAVENRIVYTDLHRRLSNHPGLGFLGRQRRRVVDFFVAHLSGIVGNTALGFMLGSAGTLGVIFGLPLDIRHIAFSSSHVGVATLDAPEIVSPATMYVVLLGILGIGLVNFIVSFGLTLLVTFRSRRASFRQQRALLVILLKRFIRAPLHWFLPLGSYAHDAE